MVPRGLSLILMCVYCKRKDYLDVLEIQNFGNENIYMVYFELDLLCIFFHYALRLNGFLM